MKKGDLTVTIEGLVKNVKEFYKKLEQCPNDRYLSWEHCYEAFYQERNSSSPNLEKLCLHLGFYLASWGMYRGSSFLLQRDYLIHREPICILLDADYEALWGIKARKLCRTERGANENLYLISNLSERLTMYYEKVRWAVCKDARKGVPKIDVSQTLITKILMGTMGCCPAYDRYFVNGIGGGVAGYRFCKTFSSNSLAELAEFYDSNNSVLDSVGRKTRKLKLPYPQMKIVDMAFWKQGFDAENRS